MSQPKITQVKVVATDDAFEVQLTFDRPVFGELGFNDLDVSPYGWARFNLDSSNLACCRGEPARVDIEPVGSGCLTTADVTTALVELKEYVGLPAEGLKIILAAVQKFIDRSPAGKPYDWVSADLPSGFITSNREIPGAMLEPWQRDRLFQMHKEDKEALDLEAERETIDVESDEELAGTSRFVSLGWHG